jgi:deoxyribonuclease-4
MIFPFNIGLKLYSTDVELIPDIRNLRRKDYFDYIELYIVPDSYEKTIEKWKGIDVPFVIHAPHTAHNVNIADSELRESNMEAYRQVKSFCNSLKSSYIVSHAGSDGTLEETIHQLRMIGDDRIRLENKPNVGLNGEVCRCCAPEEFEKLLKEGVLQGMVLDFGHAICYAAHCGLNYRHIIEDFMKYSPSIFHLCDGIYSSHTDMHLNIGKGEFNIKELLNYIPHDAMVAVETPRSSKENLDDFLKDIQILMNIFKGRWC